MAIAKRCGIVGAQAATASLARAKSSDSLGDLSDTFLESDDGSNGDLSLERLERGRQKTCMGGAELEGISQQALTEHIRDIRVFYRVAPRHKLAIVRALQANGDIVAMTGDGKLSPFLQEISCC